MTLAIGLLAASLLIGALGPWYLRGVIHPRVRPGMALTGWVASALLVVVAAVGGAVLLLVPNNGSADGLIGMATACVNAVGPGGDPVWGYVLRLSGAALVFGALVRMLVVALGVVTREYGRRAEHLSLLEVLARSEPATGVLWLDQETPAAYSVGGRRGSIVATTGVARLDPAAREAMLAHERAHLHGRHHVLVLIMGVLERAFPFVPLFRSAPSRVRVLVELAADAAAARRCGADPVRAALRAVTADGVPARSLAMSREAVELRLRWLGPVRGGLVGVACHRAGYVTAVFASLAPALAASGVVAGLVLLYCFG